MGFHYQQYNIRIGGLIEPGIPAPEPVGQRRSIRGSRSETRPEPIKSEKYRTNSQRVVRGPSGPWIPGSNHQSDDLLVVMQDDLSEYDPIVLSTSVMKTFLIAKYDIIFQSHILDPSLLWNISKISIDIDHPFFCIELSH